MKKLLIISFAVFMLLAGVTLFLNMEVTTKQGINYKWSTLKIPLYLKILDFFDRHYNYKLLSKRIVSGFETEETKFLKIFEWARANIKDVPDGLPVVDDHAWNIVVRGYGARDQISDVFTTLCNYAGMRSFYSLVRSSDGQRRLPLSFVNIDGRWTLCDPYKRAYFRNSVGRIASLEDIRSSDYSIMAPAGVDGDYYSDYIKNVNIGQVGDIDLKKARIQSPWKRFFFECKMIKDRMAWKR